MVIKTELSSFSENKIYPGHGIRFIRRDGQLLHLMNSKERRLMNQKKKPAKLTWTQAWRRMNKKIKTEEIQKKKTRKTARVITRAIVGVSLEEIKRRRAERPKRDAERAAVAKQVEEKKEGF